MPYQGVSYPIKEECSALKIHIYHMKDLFNIMKYPYLKIILQWLKMIMLDYKKRYSPKSNIWGVCMHVDFHVQSTFILKGVINGQWMLFHSPNNCLMHTWTEICKVGINHPNPSIPLPSHCSCNNVTIVLHKCLTATLDFATVWRKGYTIVSYVIALWS